MALIDQIAAQVRREGVLLDTLRDGFADEAARVLDDLNAEIRRLVGSLPSANGRLVVTEAALGRALRLRVEIQTALTAAGYQDLVAAAFDAPLDDLAATVLRGRSIVARAARVTPLDLDVLTAWKLIRQADLLELGDDLVTGVWRSTLDGMLANRSARQLTTEIAQLTDRSLAQARTVYDTATASYARQVDQLGVTPAPSDRFVYVGPQDAKTRPFCAALVGEVRTRAQLDRIDNGQIPNTLLTGGGWNCRHKWLFLADLEAEDVAA